MSEKPKARRGPPKAGDRSAEEAAQKEQSERFIEAARAVGVDESGKEFERALSKIAPAKNREISRKRSSRRP
jgi:hypothetical protein